MTLPVSPSTIEDWPDCSKGLLLAPRPQRISCGLLAHLLQFVNAVGQVSETGQHGSALAVGGPAGVLSKSDIPPIMGTVLDSRPVAANSRHQLAFITLLEGQTGGIAADFQ